MASRSGNPGKGKVELAIMDTADLMAAFHEDNPRVHSLDTDIPSVAMSLLEAGWVEIGVAYNPQTKRLVGGHGRVMAADWLQQQELEWFERQWEKWLGRGNPEERKALAQEHNIRYDPTYWRQCPVAVSKLDEQTHLAMMVRLNNSAVEGKDDPGRMARVLAKVKDDVNDLMGWENTTKKSFVQAFLSKKVEAQRQEEEEERASAEYQEKQHFERPDATDYGDGDGDAWGDEDATAESGEVHTSFQGGDGATYESVEFDTENLNEDSEAQPDIFHHSSHYSETRALLYVSYEGLDHWKDLVEKACALLDVDTVGNIAKIWRTDATIRAMEWCVAHHPDQHKLFELEKKRAEKAAQKAKKEENSEDED